MPLFHVIQHSSTSCVGYLVVGARAAKNRLNLAKSQVARPGRMTSRQAARPPPQVARPVIVAKSPHLRPICTLVTCQHNSRVKAKKSMCQVPEGLPPHQPNTWIGEVSNPRDFNLAAKEETQVKINGVDGRYCTTYDHQLSTNMR